MKCDICHERDAEVGIIIGDVYHKVCPECKPLPRVSSGAARWDRSIDLEDNEANIQQPRNKDGSVNTRFAALYPDKARAIFSEKEIRDANRN